MDHSKHFLHNVAPFSGQLNLSQLEISAMAYKRLCLELDTIANAPGPVAPASPPAPVARQGLRASASEFVPQVPNIGDRRAVDLGEEQDDYSDEIDDGYNAERNMRAPRPGIYGLRFYNLPYESEDAGDNHSEAERKRKFGYRAPRFRPNQPAGRPMKTDTAGMQATLPSKDSVSGAPHFRGPYMPLLQHRIANAEAYGLIREPDEGPSLLLEDMLKQLSRLEKCPQTFNSIFQGRNRQNSSS
ncbi:uncharacterized protein [Drosophila bipectinata]|uniref:uncharacterized protein n=1 Tax=Drosophila bipectinata TaxID=42026 RepID=UPI001C8A1044|nr:uncharacterized protein LOC108129363 [Drosophila bipectinata]